MTLAVDPRHDRVHTPDPRRERWRESYYFLAYDFRHRIGVCSSIGYRPAKGYSGSMHYAWGDGLPNLVAMEKGRFEEHRDVHDVRIVGSADRAGSSDDEDDIAELLRIHRENRDSA